ncbi:probable translation initiation factor IF-3 at C-terminar half [Coccomyxa sp. Obi]|nr:probable translation initiation factor IF-3 at C-terminar half [Coccomyxa sp. Obi]
MQGLLSPWRAFRSPQTAFHSSDLLCPTACSHGRQGLGPSHRLIITCNRPPSRGGGGPSRGRGGTSRGGRGGAGGRGGTSSRGGGNFRGGGRGGGTTGFRPPPQQGQFPRPSPDGTKPAEEPYQGGSRVGFQRRPYERPKGQFDTPINDEIEADEVRVVGVDKEPLGIMSLVEALDMADEDDLDVVLISPDASPPVVRIIEYTKYKYEQAKAAKDASKKQRESRQDLKELKFRPSTDVHDYQVRLRAAQKFIAKGDKVKLTLTFRGREMQFQEIGKDLFKKFVEDVGDSAVVMQDARMMGNQMTLLLSPNKNK